MVPNNNTFPDRVYGVGKGGIELVSHMLGHEWFQESLLRPRRTDPHSLDAYFIDSAEVEKEDIVRRIENIEETSEQVTEEVRDPDVGRVGELDVNYELLTENVNLTESLDLTGPKVAQDVASEQAFDADDWWLSDDNVDENLDFARGVYRRRGLAKAMYYKNKTQNPKFEHVTDVQSKGSIAICVGLGGGTGAGIAIDLAKDILNTQPTCDITLFGVLPTRDESDRVHANTHAILSELEYLNHTGDDDLFRDIILLPIEATNYEGKTGDNIATDRGLEEFDRAFAYALMAYYNMGQEKNFDDTPDHGPFTVAVPQVLRALVEAIEDTKTALGDAVKHHQAAMDASVEIFEALRDTINNDVGTSAQSELNKDLREDLRQRLDRIEQFTQRDLFQELEYESADSFETILEDTRKENDGIVEVIDKLHDQTKHRDKIATDKHEYVDQTDEQLGALLVGAIESLKIQCELFRDIPGIQNVSVRQALQKAARLESTRDIQLKQGNLDREKERIEDTVSQLEVDLDEVETELAEKRAARQQKIDRELSRWESDIADTLASIQAIPTGRVRDLLYDLEQELDQYRHAIENADTVDYLDEPDRGGIEAILQELRAIQREAALDPTRDFAPDLDIDAIESSLDELADAREASLRIDQDVGLLARIIPWQTGSQVDIAEAKEDLTSHKREVTRTGIFAVSGDNSEEFHSTLKFDAEIVGDQVEETVTELCDVVCANLGEGVSAELDAAAVTSLAENLQTASDADIRDLAAECLNESLSRPVELEAELADIEAELAETQGELEAVSSGSAVLTNLFEDGKFTELETQLGARESVLVDCQDIDVTGSEESAYIHKVQPESPLQIAQDSDISESSLLSDTVERQNFAAEFETLAEATTAYEYNGLAQRNLSNRTTRYRGTNLEFAVLSRAVNEAPANRDVFDVKDIVSGAFGVEDSYSTSYNNMGHPWDLAMVLFVDGVFLDNLRNAPEYKEAHEIKQRTTDIHLHHTERLEDGEVVYREDLVTVGDPDELAVYLQADATEGEDATETILEEYTTIDSIDDTSGNTDSTSGSLSHPG